MIRENGRIGYRPPGEGIRAHVDPRVVYDAKWQQGRARYLQDPRTPLLDSFMKRLSYGDGDVLEAAAGAGAQAIALAQRLPFTNVTAVDSSPAACALIEQNKPARLARESRLDVAPADVLDYLQQWARVAGPSFTGVHANSFVHFLPEAEREEFYRRVREAQVPQGIIAISLKTAGDSLLRQGQTNIVKEDERGIHAVPPDGIERLFITNPKALIPEFDRAGYEVVEIVTAWNVPEYDGPGTTGQFTGLIAQKR